MRPANGLAGFPQKRNAIVAPPLLRSGGGLGGAEEIADTAIDIGGNVVKKAADVLGDMSWDALLKGMALTIVMSSAVYFIAPAGFANLTKGTIATGRVIGDSAIGFFGWSVALPAKFAGFFSRAEG